MAYCQGRTALVQVGTRHEWDLYPKYHYNRHQWPRQLTWKMQRKSQGSHKVLSTNPWLPRQPEEIEVGKICLHSANIQGRIKIQCNLVECIHKRINQILLVRPKHANHSQADRILIINQILGIQLRLQIRSQRPHKLQHQIISRTRPPSRQKSIRLGKCRTRMPTRKSKLGFRLLHQAQTRRLLLPILSQNREQPDGPQLQLQL